jgi:hypothetical protein
MNEKYFLEYRRNGEIELYEKDGTFYNHDNQDLLNCNSILGGNNWRGEE